MELQPALLGVFRCILQVSVAAFGHGSVGIVGMQCYESD